MVKKKLENLRHQMKKHKINAYLVPSTDPHQNEYVPELWKRRKWLSGFTGSAGDMAITMEAAGLWTDSRYFLQAEEQLRGSSIELFKMGIPDVPSIKFWLKTVLKPGDTVGIDPNVFSFKDTVALEKYLNKWNLNLKYIHLNLIDTIWTDQPPLPDSPIMPLNKIYSGESTSSKLKRLREKMAAENTQLHIVSTLDSIAWLFNIRGTDITFNPVVISYAIITDQRALLFTGLKKVTQELKDHFGTDVEIYDYHEFENRLHQMISNGIRIWLDEGTISRWIVELCAGESEVFYKQSPITMFKAIKNKTEINGFKNAHIRDGAAVSKFLHWLEQNVSKGTVTELSAAERLKKYRSEMELFQGLSFNTITSYNEHGAIVHYDSSPETDVVLKPDGIYLIDSGGQYLDGTTDITRTVALGSPTDEQKDRFTRVLKGMIQLSAISYPRGTSGKQLDTIARLPLWEKGLNFGHGVGHGIGHYLNVHEGPQAISYYRCTGVAIEPGMVTSNEPGFYKTGEYGIRIENLIISVEDNQLSSEDFTFYKFETLTLCPIDLNLVEKSLLTDKEIIFLNNYHKQVINLLEPFMDKSELEWLKQATRPI